MTYVTQEGSPTDLTIQQVRHLYHTLHLYNYNNRIIYLEEVLNDLEVNNPFVLTTALSQLWFAERCWSGTKPQEVQPLWLQETALIEAFAKYHYIPVTALKVLKKEFNMEFDGQKPVFNPFDFTLNYLIKAALSPVTASYKLYSHSGLNIEGVTCPSSYDLRFLKLKHKVRIAVVVPNRSERYALYNGLESLTEALTGVKRYPTKTRVTFLNKSSIQLYGKLEEVNRKTCDLVITLN